MNTLTNAIRTKLRKAAGKATPGQWSAYCKTYRNGSTFALHTPDDDRCGNIINWQGFDGNDQPKYRNAANVKYIALANPENIMALLDALDAAEAQLEKSNQKAKNYEQVAHGLAGEVEALKSQPIEVPKQTCGSSSDLDAIIGRFQHQLDHLSDWYHIDEHSCKVNRRDLMTAVDYMRAQLAGLEAILNTPVKLPPKYSGDTCGLGYEKAYLSGLNAMQTMCQQAIKAHGLKVEE